MSLWSNATHKRFLEGVEFGHQNGLRHGKQIAQMELARKQQRERNASLIWHAIHSTMAVVGLTWSLYWWRKRRPPRV